jgi:hypothetical protein
MRSERIEVKSALRRVGAGLPRIGVAVVSATVALGCGSASAAAQGRHHTALRHKHPTRTPLTPPVLSPYFGAPFTSSKLAYTFGQAPSWTTNGEVLSTSLDSAGTQQIYRSRLDGGGQVCLTCTTVKGPNGLPQERPEGDWILFESYGQQPTHIGAPGLGGYGGDLYVMHPDGTHVHRLTTNSDPNDGAQFAQVTGIPYDNFHAYWSPDGRHIVWTHCEADPLSEGGEKWELMLGDFTVKNGLPALTNVHVVGPPYGSYETQPWSPDGKGFLFFASGGYQSPYQAAPAGWANARVYYMRVYGRGASPEHPMVTLIGDNAPFYEEQAVFTPDMKAVIMMSNRGSTLGSWYDEVAAAAQRTAFDAPDTGATQTLQFLADFDGADFSSDLYIVDGATGAIRRLTDYDQVVPEFYWNASYTKLLWTITSTKNPGYTASYTAQFHGVTHARRRIPRTTPGWLYGQPIDMARIRAQAQTPTQLGPVDNTPIAVTPPPHPSPGFPHATKRKDTVTIPVVVATYLVRWEGDLTALGLEAGESFSTAPTRILGFGQ